MTSRMGEWTHMRVLIAVDGADPIPVKAWVHGWVGVRKTDRVKVQRGRGAWTVFYRVNGLAFANADSLEEAQAVALAFKPYLRRLTEDFMDLVRAHQQHGTLPSVLAESEAV